MKKSREIVQTTRNKALLINQDTQFYGSFAEIGAGQEVARHFFQAGLASQTVAKSMSAYDKVFSDSIYGKGSRFVSQDRLAKMLEHEFKLLTERLTDRCSQTCFFAFANTVATSSHEEVPTCHGWMGIRFQTKPGGPLNDIVMHVRMLDRLRLQQQEALGILGVNLVYGARLMIDKGPQFITSLLDNLSNDRLEIEYISFSGVDLQHIDSRLMSLELVQQGITHAVMFDAKGQPLCPSDALYKKNIFVQRGTFRPLTNTNMEIMEKGLKQFQKEMTCKKDDCISFFEITMTGLQKTGRVDQKDFLDRVDTLCAMNQHVLISNFTLFADLARFLRRLTDQGIGIIIGAATLDPLFNTNYYEKFPSGIMGAFARLFDGNTRLYVYPYKINEECRTAGTFFPKPPIDSLYRYFRQTEKIVDISDCEAIDISLHSEKVRKLLSKGDRSWEDMVPAPVRDLIKKRKMFS
jgi:hypothetical protein